MKSLTSGILVSKRKKRTHKINCDHAPSIPAGCRIEENIKGGLIHWNPADVELFFVSGQQGKSVLSGAELREAVEGKPVLNARILDYIIRYLRRTHWSETSLRRIVPKQWRTRKAIHIMFWGTIFKDNAGYLFVKSLYWDSISKTLREDWCFIHDHWRPYGRNFPAAVIKLVPERRRHEKEVAIF